MESIFANRTGNNRGGKINKGYATDTLAQTGTAMTLFSLVAVLPHHLLNNDAKSNCNNATVIK